MTDLDVAIIGGGPAGATTGCLLKKYSPNLKVAIFEREDFPRDHVGESQLPPIMSVLDEMGCWDKVEAANFPIKIGATYRWGRTPELWHFEFLPNEWFKEEPRPAKLAGQRLSTAFQVDRAVYDKILLDHAREMGVEVHQPEKVTRIGRDGDRVSGLELESGQEVKARYYVDASGSAGTLRRAMGVECVHPTNLRNIAIWDYWENAEWAVEIGIGGTRIQILSLPYAWIWFIPLGPTRTSIGLVTPAEYIKSSGKKPAELYAQSLNDEPIVRKLIKNAVSENNVRTTRDWSFLAERQAGENWFLTGESSGFADPILSAGMTMAHLGGREACLTILELERSPQNRRWLLEQYSLRQKQRIDTHIRFADYWYSANSQFEDLKEFSAQLARDVGLDLAPDKAWAWLAQGGFINEDATFGTGGFSFSFIKGSGEFLTEIKAESPLQKNNVFVLDLSGASHKDRAAYRKGGVSKDQCYVRGDRVLPIVGALELLVNILQLEKTSAGILARVRAEAERHRDNQDFILNLRKIPEGLEAMILDGWVKASYDPSLPLLNAKGTSEVLRWEHESAK